MSGTRARPPVLMKMRSAPSSSPLTLTVRGPVKRAWPWITRPCLNPVIQSFTPTRDRATTASLRAFTRFMSTRTPLPVSTPYSAARRAIAATLALATSVFVGMQPVFTQVPPKCLRSMIATFIPCSSKRCASDGPD